MKFLGSTPPGKDGYRHETPARLGVLLVNLGTPDSPTSRDVRKFLAQFLWDPRVVEVPRPLWWLMLHGVILRFRPRRTAHAYAQVWMPEGSPLLVHSRALTHAVGVSLTRTLGHEIPVALGMTYGNPSIAGALATLHAANVRRLLVLPLYPQYAGSTTGAVFDSVSQALATWRWVPELRFVGQYHDDPAYIDAIAASVLEHWRTQERKHLLFSFHGLPRRHLLAGDPYFCHCHKTARLVAEKLGLAETDWTLSFQSRIGRDHWLKPYTDETLLAYARGPHKRVTVVCPGFATDCLETLEEIALRNRADFLTHGGEVFDYVPALNATPRHVELLTRLLLRHAEGWPETAGPSHPEEQDAQAKHTVALARRQGAAG